jgi:hypothetical protein
MKKLIIPSKMSNTGTIYDISSDQYDREIKFPKNSKFAVVLPAYYGDHYTTHKLDHAAIAKCKLTNQYCVIIDIDGNEYDIAPGFNEDYLIIKEVN